MNKGMGLVLGNGLLPVLLLEKCHKPVCALLGSTPENIHLAECSRHFSITQIPQMLEYFKEKGVKKICIAGGVRKPSIGLSLIHWKNFQLLWRLLTLPNKGDNNVLSTVLSYIESKGFEVISATEVIPDLLAEQGCLTRRQPTKHEMKGIDLGVRFLSDISKYDISQACVVDDNCIIALEGLEGTARMITRIGEINRGGAVLIKMPKKGQTLKIDMPTIGIETIEQCVKANIQGIAIKAEATIVLNKEEVITLADQHGMFVYSVF